MAMLELRAVVHGKLLLPLREELERDYVAVQGVSSGEEVGVKTARERAEEFAKEFEEKHDPVPKMLFEEMIEYCVMNGFNLAIEMLRSQEAIAASRTHLYLSGPDFADWLEKQRGAG